jgi:hypothetical protein
MTTDERPHFRGVMLPRLDVVTALRRLAEIDKASKRHPTNRRPSHG